MLSVNVSMKIILPSQKPQKYVLTPLLILQINRTTSKPSYVTIWPIKSCRNVTQSASGMKYKSETLADDLELICTEASEHGIIEHISGGTGLYPAVFTAYITI